MTLLLIVFQFLSALDGVLTYIGVGRYGIAAEANPIIRTAMYSMGVLPTILLFKGFAALGGFWLWWCRFRTPQWQVITVFAVAIAFLTFVVVPWAIVLWTIPV